MGLTAGTIALIGAGLAAAGATGGAIGSGVNRRNALDTKNAWYDYAEDYYKSQMYTSLYDTPGGKALLKLTDNQREDEIDALNNRIEAGGATMENALAARQALNENRDKMDMQVLQADEQNRRQWQNQLLNLKGQRASDTANSYYQAAQDWNQWGGQMAQAGMSLMNAGLLGGGELSASAWAKSAPAGDVLGAMAERTENEMFNPMMQPITGVGGLKTPGVTGPKGGLAGR